MKDILTRCDTCDKLYECIKNGKVQDVTIRTDIMRHYIPNYDCDCDKFCRQESEEETVKKSPCYTCTLDCDTTCEIYKGWLQKTEERGVRNE